MGRSTDTGTVALSAPRDRPCGHRLMGQPKRRLAPTVCGPPFACADACHHGLRVVDWHTGVRRTGEEVPFWLDVFRGSVLTFLP